MMLEIERIVSGGQTGADRAGLDWALANAVPHEGWCPAGRRAEDGEIASGYALRETAGAGYLVRTEWNVRDSDGTVIFSLAARLGGGSMRTLEFAQRAGKPVLHLSKATCGALEDAAWELVKDWTVEEMQSLRDNVPKMALKTPFRGGTLQDIAIQTVSIAHDGLKQRAVPGGKSPDEAAFLETLQEIAESGVSPAERLLEKFAHDWQGDINRVYKETAY